MKDNFRKKFNIEAGTIFPDIDMMPKSTPHEGNLRSTLDKSNIMTAKKGKNKSNKENA